MQKICVGTIPKEARDKVSIVLGEQKIQIFIHTQKTGFGEKRLFQCPVCGARRSYLYIDFNNKEVFCRGCSPYRSLYWGIQNTTKGGQQQIEYMMGRIANKYNIEFKFPFTYYQLILKKPKRMHNESWNKVLRQLQILENMRTQAIFYERYLSSQTINYVLKNCLYEFTLEEIEKYLLDWQHVANRHRKSRG